MPGWRPGKLTEAARALFDPPPDEKALAATGLTLADFDADQVEVWPENWPALEMFAQLQTQWRLGFGGRAGLDYGVLFALMERRGLTGEAWEERFAAIQVMERAALEVMHT